MLFRLWRERRERNQYIVDALAFLVHRIPIIMTALDDLKAAAARLESVSATAGQKLDADAATIKDDVAKLASLASAPQPASEADLKVLTERLNAVADGLSGHLAPVADAAGQVAAAAPAA